MDREAFDAHLTLTLSDAKTIEEFATDETIVPPEGTSLPFDPSRTLPSVTFAHGRQTTSDFEVVGKLGEGGMGIVELAEQRALRRLVAVKTVRTNDDNTRKRLLEEAQVLGQLEHPNVVPVYVLGERESDKLPVIVMKRVEGEEWTEKIKRGEEDLEWHIRVLIQVCNAIRFAHDRGIIHRDLKPENIMIGDYGEVYVLDWGVALSMTGEFGLPSPQTTQGLGGTPAYMAPEMAEAKNVDIDQRTDVYLLGAVLHEILTGSAPHKGDSLLSVCFAAFHSEPKQYGDDVNLELADIARKSMSKLREDRFQDVGAFARALDDALEHEASFDLSHEAQWRLEEFAKAEGEQAVKLLTESEFGYRQALNIWSDNPLAIDGLEKCLVARINRAIDAEDIASARAAFEELRSPDPELKARIDAAEEKYNSRAERVGYLEDFEREFDIEASTGSRQRFAVIAGIGFALLATYASFKMRTAETVPDVSELLITFPRVAAIAGVGLFLYRKKLLANVANRRLSITIVLLFVLMFVMRLTFYLLEGEILDELVAETVLICGTAVVIGVMTGSMAIAAAALSYALVAIVGAYTQSSWMLMQALAFGHVLFFGTMAWVWRPRKETT